ncbi:MAG: hypothetical protein M3440_04020, partial [Chloroflexota bacterium]|nr:hypothetical protein [Chloroflexota bacterium]
KDVASLGWEGAERARRVLDEATALAGRVGTGRERRDPDSTYPRLAPFGRCWSASVAGGSTPSERVGHGDRSMGAAFM